MSGIRTLVVAFDFPPHAAIGTQRTLRFVRYADGEGWPTAVLTGIPACFRPGTPIDTGLLQQVPWRTEVARATVFRPLDGLGRLMRGGLRKAPSQRSAGKSGGNATSSAGPRQQSWLRSLKAVIDAASSIPDSEVGWLVPAVIRGTSLVRRWSPDVIYSSGPPWTGHLVAGVISVMSGRPWVADCRDPWARAPWRSARTRPFANRAASRLERWMVRRAAAVVFTTESVRAEFAGKYGERLSAKFFVVPNGCDPSIFEGVDGTRSEQFSLLHAGSLYGGRDPRPLFRAVASAMRSGRIDAANFRLKLLGIVALGEADLRREAQALGIESVVELLPREDHRGSLRAMKSASALLLLQQGTTLSVPAKLYEYLAAEKRILAICEEGETAELVRSSGAGIVAPPRDESAIENALVSLVSSQSQPDPRPERRLYDGRIGAARIAEIIAAIVQRPAVSDADALNSVGSGA